MLSALLWIQLFVIGAQARVYDLYRADYPKGAFCSAIAGACASDPTLENAFFQNPAALTASGNADWDFDGDYNSSSSLEPGMKSQNETWEDQFMGGFGWSNGEWGIGIGFAGIQDNVDANVTLTDDVGFTHNFPLSSHSTSLEIHLPVSYRLGKFSLGAALVANSFKFSIDPGLNSLDVRMGFILGVTEQPLPNFRWGAWWKSPVTNYVNTGFDVPAFGNTLVYNEDLAIHHPWILATGASYMPWYDARTVYFDIDTIGTTDHGYLLTYDTYSSTNLGRKTLRKKGRHVAFEPRLGYRMPWPWPANNKGTLHFGSYLETSRWEGLPDRLHYTSGISYQVLNWLELMGGIDVAKDFTQLFLTFR